MDFLENIYKSLASIYQPLVEYLQNAVSDPVQIIQIVIIGVFVWYIYRYIRGTHGEQLLKGILVIAIAWFISIVFKLEILSSVLGSLLNVVIFGLVVIFQPELRRLLGYLGQPGMFTRNILNFNPDNTADKIVSAICEAVKHLSKTHTGALIVIEEPASPETYLEVGTPINADTSVELILTIFHPNTPLHDGAIVISGTKILAAGVLLPLTEDPKLSWQYGTRHRAAIGMSEMTSSLCIVVSEETGEISMAKAGVLNKFSTVDELKKTLEEMLGVFPSSEKKAEFSKSKFQEIFPTNIGKWQDMIMKPSSKDKINTPPS